MRGLSIAITGNGQLLSVWPTHAMKRFKGATIYDRSAAVTAFRQDEVNLGQQGHLNPAGQASAQRTAQNIANPPSVDATLTFAGSAQNGTVKVKCKNGTETAFQVRLNGLGDAAIQQAFQHVDAAITRCKTGRPMA